MIGQTRARSTRAAVLSVLLAGLVVTPSPVARHGRISPAALARERTVDLAPALAADGTFHGARGVAGTVDTSAWTLVSDLTAGAPPRFAHAGSVSVAAA